MFMLMAILQYTRVYSQRTRQNLVRSGTLTSIFAIEFADAVKQPCAALPDIDIRPGYEEGSHGAI